MSEIYWITRIGALDTLFGVMWAVSLTTICGGVLSILLCASDLNTLDDDFKSICKKIISCLCIVLSIGVVGDIVLPSREDTMLIYGLGSMIDYVQANDKAKQLPDKAIDVLNRYMDEAYKESVSEVNSKEDKD